MSVFKATSLDLSKVSFSDVKVDNNGRKMVYVNYNGGKILVQTPKMYVPNGVKRWRKKDAADNKDDSFEMELSFAGKDNTDKNSQEIGKFHDILLGLDDMVKQNIISHSKEWLGKAKAPSMEAVEEAFYNPCVRECVGADGTVYPSRVRTKLDRERDQANPDNFTGRFLSNKRYRTPVMMFDDNKNPIEFNENNFETVVPKGSQVVAVLELVYLTISTKVSAKWKLVQAKVSKSEKSITGYAMLDDEEDNEQVVETVNNVVNAAEIPDDLDTENEVKVAGEESVENEESEEEVEESEEESEVEVVKPKVSQAPAKPAPKSRAKKAVAA
jgi:hypothetical protein